MSFDFVEEQIRRAQERGDFDNLPGAGKPIEGLDKPYDPNWWARDFIARTHADESDRRQLAELEEELARVWAQPTEVAVRTRVTELNQRAGSDVFDPNSVVETWRKFRTRRHR